ncbi:hypothetical protein FQR65_LT09701 [Abscondita terminalis]|nr:hypothetical protein FQR65_LT09701 [Abscondita terminalis]
MNSMLVTILLFGVVVGQELKEYHDSNIQFSSAIYTAFASKHDGNFLICPLSAQTILSLAAIGAKGQTAQELTSALRIPSNPDKIQYLFKQISPYLDVLKSYQLTSANKIYVSNNIKLKNEYETIAKNTFKSEIQNINFKDKNAATNEINRWVETKTHDKIKQLLSESSIKPNTVAVFINAVYFNGDWVNKFGQAYPMEFHVSRTNTVDVDMMTQRNDFNYYFDENLNVEYMEFPFVGDDVVMTIALPKEEYGLSNLEKSISAVLSEKPYQKHDSIVSIPKFTMESKIDFKSVLQSLGATIPFTNEADLSEISYTPIKIDEIVQKTFIEVTEDGATAAGATEFALIPQSVPTVFFSADHPFIYYLRHKINGVIFTFASKHDGDFLICPLSAQTILSLAAIGARGQTAQELTSALRIPTNPDKIESLFKQISPHLDVVKHYQLTSANKIYVNKTIKLKNDYETIAKNTFKSEVQNINFEDKNAATNEINKWVETKTHDKIKQLLSENSIKPNTVALLVNAVYFNGEWVHKFGQAYPMQFYISKSKIVEINMMAQRNHFNYYYDEALNVDYMEFPFIGNDVVMTIALPREKFGLSKLEKSISTVLSEQPYRKHDSIVNIPKFTMSSEIDFKSILQSVSVLDCKFHLIIMRLVRATIPFTNEADLSEISDTPLKIDEVVQKTFIEVTEKGATAAGATQIGLIPESMPSVFFSADHPFIYYLRHKVNGIIFVGRFINP